MAHCVCLGSGDGGSCERDARRVSCLEMSPYCSGMMHGIQWRILKGLIWPAIVFPGQLINNVQINCQLIKDIHACTTRY